jgi:NADH:ubiquinone oxidoreductase subunit 6 (subunit J)
MTYAALFELIIWVFLVFWVIWFVYVQLERLNPNIFEKLKRAVLERLRELTGVLRVIGLILYSPYVMPIRAVITWLIVVLVIFIL